MQETLDPGQIINGSSIPTFVINNDHRVIHWNKACEALTGMSATEVIGTDKQWMAFYNHQRPVMADLVVDETNESHLLSYYNGEARKSVLIEDAYEAETYCMTFSAGGKWLFLTAALLRDSDGRIVGAIETLQDVSERKIFQENEYALKLELAQSVSELRNSLNLLQETRSSYLLVLPETMVPFRALRGPFRAPKPA